MALLVAKVPFWEGASKGGFTICDTKKLCSAENTIFIVFSAKHSFADMKECNLKKKNLPKIRGCLPKCKKVFFGLFFWFFGFVFFFLCVFVLVFCKKAQKGYFPAILEVFFKFCSPERPVFKILLFFLFCFLFWFSFLSSLSKFHFSLLFVHQPPFRKHYYFGFLLFFYFLAFSFPNVCLFLWNKLS